MTNGIYTTKLNNNRTVVLARNDKRYGITACTYQNNTQALKALANVQIMGIKATIRDTGRVKFIQILEA